MLFDDKFFFSGKKNVPESCTGQDCVLFVYAFEWSVQTKRVKAEITGKRC